MEDGVAFDQCGFDTPAYSVAEFENYTSLSRRSNGIIPYTFNRSASMDEDDTEPMAVGIMPIPYSSNLPLPSSTHISMTNAPDSTFLMGVVLTPPKSLPLMNSRCASPSFRFLCFCNPGSAAIHGVSGPNGGCTSVSSRSSVIRVKEQSGGSAFKAEERVDNLEMVARNCSGRSAAGGGLPVKGVRISVDGTEGNALVEKRKRSSGAEEGGGA